MNKSTLAVTTKRRAVQVFLLGLAFFAVQMVPIQQVQAAGGKPLLLLADADTTGTLALEAELGAAGYEVTKVVPEHSWDGTNPPLDGFQAVVHLNGATFGQTLDPAAQLALVEFVRKGGGYIGGQYNGFEQQAGKQKDMQDLVLQLTGSEWPDSCPGCDMTWTQVAEQQGHPVLSAVPEAFSFYADAHEAGPVVEFASDPSAVLMTATLGGAAVIVREFEEGRVVSFASASNALSSDKTLQDSNILLLYTNAADWVTRSTDPLPVPQCNNSPGTVIPPDAPISFTATAEGLNYTVEITDYDCFKINRRGKRIDKMGSCRVSYTGDTLTLERTGGVGTHIVWTAVTMDSLGNLSEEAFCEVEVVRPCKRKDKDDDDDDKGKKKRSKKRKRR